jgi:hypothetical protein
MQPLLLPARYAGMDYKSVCRQTSTHTNVNTRPAQNHGVSGTAARSVPLTGAHSLTGCRNSSLFDGLTGACAAPRMPSAPPHRVCVCVWGGRQHAAAAAWLLQPRRRAGERQVSRSIRVRAGRGGQLRLHRRPSACCAYRHELPGQPPLSPVNALLISVVCPRCAVAHSILTRTALQSLNSRASPASLPTP